MSAIVLRNGEHGAALLPDAISKHSPIGLVIGFAAGTVAMLGIAKVMERFEPEEGDEDHAHLSPVKRSRMRFNEVPARRACWAPSGLMYSSTACSWALPS